MTDKKRITPQKPKNVPHLNGSARIAPEKMEQAREQFRAISRGLKMAIDGLAEVADEMD